MAPGDRSLLLLTAFARALSHKIRTPLAVISNEISALPAAEDEDVHLIRGKMREIVSILKESIPPDPKAVSIGPVALAAIVERATGEKLESEIIVATDAALCEQLIKLTGAALSKSCQGAVAISLETAADGRAALVLETEAGQARARAGTESESMTEFLSVALGLELIEAPLIDGIVDALGVTLRAGIEKTAVVRLSIPRA